jgi:hypothetical protein
MRFAIARSGSAMMRAHVALALAWYLSRLSGALRIALPRTLPHFLHSPLAFCIFNISDNGFISWQ